MTTKPRAQQPDTPTPEETIAVLRQQLAQQESVVASLKQRIGNMAVEIADRDAVIAQQFAQNMRRQTAAQTAAQADEPAA